MNSEKKIKTFYKLKKNWNDNGAPEISSEIITNALTLDKLIPIETDVFPTAKNSIQFEFEKDRYYLEFELSRDDKITIFKIIDKKEYTELITFNKAGVEKILDEIKKFQNY